MCASALVEESLTNQVQLYLFCLYVSFLGLGDTSEATFRMSIWILLHVDVYRKLANMWKIIKRIKSLLVLSQKKKFIVVVFNNNSL